jgi:hypothetical protein
VSYDGEPFHCLEKHTSRVGLEPPKAPKLWQVEVQTGSGGARGAGSEEKLSGDGDASKSPSRPGEKVAVGSPSPDDRPRRGGDGSDGNINNGHGGLTDPPNRQRYGRDLSGQIGRFVELLAQEQRRMSRTHVLTTATPAEAPPDYRPAVADYFEALARASAKSETAPAASAP